MTAAIAIVFFDSDNPGLTGEGVAHMLSSQFPDVTVGNIQSEENTISFNVDPDVAVVLGHMPGPVPWDSLAGPASVSLLWPESEQPLNAHKSHMIVTIAGEMEPVPQAILLTQATTAVLSATESALGVLWCNAQMLVRKDLFCEFAEKIMPQGPPLHIWLNMRAGDAPDGSGLTAGFTEGMTALGHMEFETLNSTDDVGELRDRLYSLAEYVLENGPVIRDGDTIGESANERIRVIYADSAFEQEGQVMRLDYSSLGGSRTGGGKKPWWKFW